MLDVVGLLGERLAACLPFLVNLGLGLGLATLVAGCSVDRDRWDHSPSGRAGVIDLLQRYGFTPRERLASLAKIDKSVSALVLLPGATVDDASWEAIATWTGEGGALIVAGGQRTLPVLDRRAARAPERATRATAHPRDRECGADRLPAHRWPTPPVRSPAPAHGRRAGRAAGQDRARPRLGQGRRGSGSRRRRRRGRRRPRCSSRGKTPYAVERTYEGGGRAIVLADDRLLTNASLLVGDNARLLDRAAAPGRAEAGARGRADRPGVAEPRSRPCSAAGSAPAMLQLSLLVLLFFVYKGAHFGRPVDPGRRRRRAFSEHARAIGLLYGRTRAGRHALEAYGGYALERMRERLQPGRGQGDARRRRGGGGAHRPAAGRGDARAGRIAARRRGATRPGSGERCRRPTAAKDLATLRDLATLLANTGGAGERIRAQRKA